MHKPFTFKSIIITISMIRKIGLEVNTKRYRVAFASRLRYAIITILNISHRYYSAIYCRSKDIVLLLKKSSHGVLCSGRLFRAKNGPRLICFVLLAVYRHFYTEIPGYVRETHLETFPGDTFTRHKPGNVNIRCADFLRTFHILTIRFLFNMSHLCLQNFGVGDGFITVEQQV